MVDFSKLLSPESRARMAQEEAETFRLYKLANAWLARELLKLARLAQQASPERTPDEPTYDARLIWGILPELARRLGVVKLTTNEIDWEIRELTDYELRLRAGSCLQNIGYSRAPGWNLLTREAANGNPVVFAVDRLCAGELLDRNDVLVTRLSEIASYRQAPYQGTWTPAMFKRAS